MDISSKDRLISTFMAPVNLVIKAARAVENVYDRLLRMAKALDQAGVPYAVVGGNAVAIWVATVDDGAVRNTKDVDILLARNDLEQAEAVMSDAGFSLTEVDGITMFLDRNDPMPSRGIHVVFVGEHIRPHYKHPAPQISNMLRNEEGVCAIGLSELLVMKLQSYRDIDRVHIRDLISVGLVDDRLANNLPAELRQRLDEIRSNPDE